MKAQIYLFFLLHFLLIGCSEANKISEDDFQDKKKKDSGEILNKKKHKMKKNSSKPQVTEVKPKLSKPLSKATGISKNDKNKELYIVPNRFPLKDNEDANDKKNEDGSNHDEK